MQGMDCFDVSYPHLVNHIVPGPQSLSYFVPFVLLPVALLIPPETLSHRGQCWLFLPVIAAAVVHAWIAMGAVDVISVDSLLWSLYLIGAKDPRKDFVYMVKIARSGERQASATMETTTTDEAQAKMNASAGAGSQGIEQSSWPSQTRHTNTHHGFTYLQISYPAEILPRLRWVGTLLISLRLTDWKIGSPRHDRKQPAPPSGRTHLEFIAATIFRSVLGYILLDLSSYVISRDPYFITPSIDLYAIPSFQSIAALPSFIRTFYSAPVTTAALRALLTATQAWSLISQQFYLPMVLPVTLNYFHLLPDAWSPHLWPPYFGAASVILRRGLRGFWSTYWHQSMRFVVAGPAESMVALLMGKNEKRRNRVMEYALLTIVAFGLSGFIHTGLVPRSPGGDIGANRIRLYVAGFFWLQPVGIALEKIAAAILGRIVPSSFSNSGLGRTTSQGLYAGWIIGWACICFPLLAEAGRHMGYFKHYTVPWSALHWWRFGHGWMWDCLAR